MAQYKTCPFCGSNLDHGEQCDCDGVPRPASEYSPKRVMPAPAAKDKRRSKRKSGSRVRTSAKYR